MKNIRYLIGASGILLLILTIRCASPIPSVTFTPTTGPIGTLLAITGTSSQINLSTAKSFAIGRVSPTLVSQSSTALVGLVMPGTLSEPIWVTSADGTVTQGGVFTLSRTGIPSIQQSSTPVVGTGNVGNSNQGSSVAISADGNTILIGGSADGGNVGAVWVFFKDSTGLSQQTKLIGTGKIGNSKQGTSVALSADGNTALVGATGDNTNVGAAWVFTRNNGSWSQQAKLIGTGNSGSSLQGSGVALSADGNTALVGGYGDATNVGAAWVFIRSDGIWSQQGSKLVGTGRTGATSQQGYAVALSADGNTALVGGNTDASNVGAVWVFTRNSGLWAQQGSKLVGSGSTSSPNQGKSVGISADGNTALIGGPGDASQGAVWVFTRSGGTWTQQGSKLVGTGSVGNANQGTSVGLSADGTTAVIGGPNDDSNLGAVWVFTMSNGTWSQFIKLVGTGNTGNSKQGTSVAISPTGSILVLGGSSDDSSLGAAWIFQSSF